MISPIAGDIIGSVYERNNIKTKQLDLFSPDWRVAQPHPKVFDFVFLRRVPHPCGFDSCKGGSFFFLILFSSASQVRCLNLEFSAHPCATGEAGGA
jgi:hypothetical protein